MKPRDMAIWERFISQNPDRFQSVEYDVHVGDPRDNDENLSAEMQRDREALGRRKIDVVAYDSGHIHIIEVKPNAGATALGQAIMYDYLYTRDHKPKLETIATIVTDVASPNLQDLCNEHNILLVEVGTE